MKHTFYMRKEWRTDDRREPMNEKELDKAIKEQALRMRAAHENGK